MISMDDIGSWVTLGVVGLVVGSFLNVVIHRLPIMIERALGEGGEAAEQDRYDLAWPPSACPCCGHRIRPWENLPLVSFVLLRGRCAECATPISWRYPVVEILAAVLPVLMGTMFADPLQVAAAAVFVWFAIAITAVDVETHLIPDALSLPLLWIGLVLAAWQAPFVSAADAVLGAATGYAILGGVRWGGERIFGRPALGGGDTKLFAALGAWLGWQGLLSILIVASCTGSVVGGMMILVGWAKREQPVPFGPYLCLGGLASLALERSLYSLL